MAGSEPEGVRGAFRRLETRVGAEGLARLCDARVAVFGLGAVGSFAVEALARSGVGHLRLVDFDEVRPSNLNRQLFALSDTVGRPKVDVAVERVRNINPAIDVDARRAFFDAAGADDLLAPRIDWVVDAIDSVGPKVGLIAEAVRRGIPIISAMGAADRSDPLQLRLGDLEDSETCPLARHVRKRLHKLDIRSGVTAVWSVEPATGAIVEDGDEGEGVVARGRSRRTLPSMAPLPGIFGLMIANHVIWAIVRGNR